ncbi:hypothetical protein Scep_017650 [Stephania cephalantha]|uniref:Uncharacterized protein n=1 Tax=Stephania cephalantha TaxID=152367 RepID=A0AAP0NTR6_9MAGN
MLYSALTTPISSNCFVNFNYPIERKWGPSLTHVKKQKQCCIVALRATRGHHVQVLAAAAAAAVLLTWGDVCAAEGLVEPQQPIDDSLFNNVPQTLSSEDQCTSGGDCRRARIQRPKSREAESCTVKCVTTCIRGGAGSPGEGPLNARRPIVVFKQGFRSRQYCLVECSDICNLISDMDSRP